MATEECSHCGEQFDDEEAYLRHLQDEHGDELGAIEQRRVESLSDDDDSNVAVYAGAVGALALVGVLAYLLFFSGGGASSGGGSDGPYGVGSVHYHGTINVTIDGTQLDFSRQKFQLQADAFHFEGGDGERWHAHAKGVTLAYAMQTLGIEVTEDTVTYGGTTYGDDPGETVTVTVDGEPVNPEEYVLEEGDRVRIVTNASDSG